MLDLVNNDGNTALHSAVLAGNLEVVEFLIDSAKAKIEVGFFGHTLLTESLIMGNDELFNYLLEKQIVDVNTKIKRGQTVLHLATFRNNTDLVKKLIEKHHADPDIADNSNIVPLILAAYKGNLELVEFFLESDLHSNKTNTVLSTAASFGHTHIIEYMIAKHKIPIDIRVLEDKTMLDIAITKGHRNIIKFLLQKGEDKFDVESILFNSIDNIHMLDNAQYIGANTFKGYPAEVYNYHTSKFIFDSLDKRQIMDELLFIINNSALIRDEEKTYNGLNVLHYAAKRGNLPVIKAYLKRNLIQVFKAFNNSCDTNL